MSPIFGFTKTPRDILLFLDSICIILYIVSFYSKLMSLAGIGRRFDHLNTFNILFPITELKIDIFKFLLDKWN